HNESSTRKEGIPSEKRRKTKVRPAGQCFAKIKVLHLVTDQVVQVERYLNSPDHAHTLEDSEKLKRSKAVRVLVEREAVKNYPSPAITSAIKEYATVNLGLSESIKELRCKEVANIKYKVRGSQNAPLIGNMQLALDIRENQLEKLQRFGWLTLLDSTHKTNRHDWCLFSLYIRDSHGCWNVGAHFFVSKEDSSTVAEALKIIKKLGDIEGNAITLAFLGLQAGEQECSTIFCTIHVMRTWMSKVYDVKTRNEMIKAMHKQTKIGYKEVVQQAADKCPVPTIQKYIVRNYKKNTHQWALWARQHSPLLMQVTSTNPIESYHSELKRMTSPYHGLIGACHNIVAVDAKKWSDAEYVAFEFHTKKISAFGVDQEILNEVHKFPYPIQKKVIDEIFAVAKRLEKGKGPPGLIALDCQGLFFRRYLLPCRHIFHDHIYGTNKLTIDSWRKFQRIFEDNRFEVYEGRELVEVEVPEKSEAEKATENRRMAVNELMEQVRDMYWWVEEKGDVEQANSFMRELNLCVGSVLMNNRK
ncbi:12873_t:CDS:2, partial [Cetraspora pellucida]